MYSAAESSSSIVAERPRLSRIGLRHRAELVEHHEVLHVACADLQDVRVLGHYGGVADVEHLGHDRQADRVARSAQQLQALHPHALERVRARAGLERAAAEHRGASGCHATRGREHLLFALDGARTRDDAERSPADGGRPHPHDRVLRLEVAAHELERLEDPNDLLDTRQALELERVDDLAVPDDADDGLDLTARQVRLGAGLGEQIDDVLNVFGRRVVAHDDEHGVFTPLARPVRARVTVPATRPPRAPQLLDAAEPGDGRFQRLDRPA